MELTKRQILTWLVICFFIGGLYAKKDKKDKHRCQTDNDCPSYSQCYNKLCVCKHELHGDGKECTAYAASQCQSDEDCPGKPKSSEMAKCINRTCRCVGMYAGNGEYCREAKECPNAAKTKCGKNEYCMIDPLYPNDHKCVCKEGKWPLNGKCEECAINRQCTKTYSICVNGTCTCKDEHILGKKSCDPAPLHVCKADKDCDSRAKCEDGKCICQGNTTGNGKYCRDKGPCLEEFEEYDCGVDGQCYTDPNRYKHPICTCPDGKKCTVPLHKCNITEDCHKDAECHRGECHCIGKRTGNGKLCRESLACPVEYKEKCKAAGIGVVSCVVDPHWPDQPFCKCHLDFKTSEAGICVEITECEKNGLVCPTGEICKQDKGTYGCACPDGYKKIRTEGKSTAGNRTCQDIDECKQEACSAIVNSVCVNMAGSYKCECKKGFHKNADGSVCEVCNCGADEVCKNGICKCKPGFIKNSDGECEDVDECSLNEEACSGANEECVNEQGSYSCECQSGYEKRNGVCVKKKECNCKQHEKCRKGECKCKRGYKKNKKGHRVPRVSIFQAGSGHSLHVSSSLCVLILGMLGRLAFTA